MIDVRQVSPARSTRRSSLGTLDERMTNFVNDDNLAGFRRKSHSTGGVALFCALRDQCLRHFTGTRTQTGMPK